MFTEFAIPSLEKDAPEGYRDARRIEYPCGDESLISRLLGDLARRHPSVTSRARLQGTESDLTIRITLSVEGTDKNELRDQLEAASADLRARLGLEVESGG